MARTIHGTDSRTVKAARKEARTYRQARKNTRSPQ